MANQAANHDRTKKPGHQKHNGVLFFGGHTRIKPKQQNQQRTNIPVAWQDDIEKNKQKQKQKKIPDAEKSDPFESKKEDPFAKKVVYEDPFTKNTDSPKPSCIGRILQSWADEESVLRLSWMTVVAVILSLLGATVFYFIERNTKCKWNFAKSLWFVNTISTTIGYGTLSPCSNTGRAMSVVFACVGIPTNVVALSDVGKLLSRLLRYMWAKIKAGYKSIRKRCKRKTRTEQLITIECTTNEESDEAVPLTMALLITLTWFTVSACFFCLTEPTNMGFFTALYFVMISVTTIGFGDVAPKDYDLVVIHYFFIIIGIALFSMAINIVQDKVDSMNDRVEALISKEYAKAQQDGIKLVADDEKAAREHVRTIIKKQKGGGLLRLVMGKNMENRLVDDYLEKARKAVATTQTDNFVHDREVMAVPIMISHNTQVSLQLPGGITVGTQLKWVPTRYSTLDYLDLSNRSRSNSRVNSEKKWRI